MVKQGVRADRGRRRDSFGFTVGGRTRGAAAVDECDGVEILERRRGERTVYTKRPLVR